MLIAIFELLEVADLLGCQLAEDFPRARILDQLDAASVELHAASLGGDGDAQRVAREKHLGRGRVFVRRAAGGAGLARAVNLDDALARGERARRRHFLDERLDVGAEELVGAGAGLADQVKVTRMAIGMLEAEPAFAEVHLAGDARLLHPLQRAVDRGTADSLILWMYY